MGALRRATVLAALMLHTTGATVLSSFDEAKLLRVDAILVLGNALRRCGDPEDGEALARALAETRGLRGVTGTLSLDTPDRTPVKDAVIVSLVGGRRRYHDTVEAP